MPVRVETALGGSRRAARRAHWARASHPPERRGSGRSAPASSCSSAWPFVHACTGVSGDRPSCSVSGPSTCVELPSTPSTAVSSADALARLIELGDAWLSTAGDRHLSDRRRGGRQPTSTHQCLRQMVDTRVRHRAVAPAMQPAGELELAWDPPERWRVEVTTPVDRFTVISTRSHRYLPADPRRCRDLDSPRERRSRDRHPLPTTGAVPPRDRRGRGPRLRSRGARRHRIARRVFRRDGSERSRGVVLHERRRARLAPGRGRGERLDGAGGHIGHAGRRPDRLRARAASHRPRRPVGEGPSIAATRSCSSSVNTAATRASSALNPGRGPRSSGGRSA